MNTSLCPFATYIATSGLKPQTIKGYLAGLQHLQIAAGLSDPFGFSTTSVCNLGDQGITDKAKPPNDTAYPEDATQCLAKER